jgi:hypothetical protein
VETGRPHPYHPATYVGSVINPLSGSVLHIYATVS